MENKAKTHKPEEKYRFFPAAATEVSALCGNIDFLKVFSRLQIGVSVVIDLVVNQPRLKMENLPAFALEEIFTYLDPKTAFNSFSVVCTRFSVESRLPHIISRYLSILMGIMQEYEIPYSSFTAILTRNFSTSERQYKRVLLTGFATSGGIDENNMIYWVGNMFEDGTLKAYCSRDNKNNIVCAAVLSSLVNKPEPAELIAAKTEIAHLIRANTRLRAIIPELPEADSAVELTHREAAVFQQICERFPEMFYDDIGDGSPRTRQRHIVELARKLGESKTKFSDVLVDPNDVYRLEMPIDKAQIFNSPSYFCAQEITVSRKGRYTCPVETFIVFVSQDFVPLECEQFSRYNNLLQVRDVEHLASSTGLEITPGEEEGKVVYLRFRRVPRNLQPVFWGKFISREGEELTVKLDQVFAGKYFYLKAISPDNRMQEMHDQHDHTNIDVPYAGLSGWVETFT